MTVTKSHQSNTCDRGIRDDDNPCVSMNIGSSQLPGLCPGLFGQAVVWACGSETDSRTGHLSHLKYLPPNLEQGVDQPERGRGEEEEKHCSPPRPSPLARPKWLVVPRALIWDDTINKGQKPLSLPGKSRESVNQSPSPKLSPSPCQGQSGGSSGFWLSDQDK